MNNLKKNVAVLAMIVFSFVASAQTVRWSMLPSDKYSDITRIGKNLYKVVSGGKIGLVTAKGEELAAAENDVLTGFYEGKALLTRRDSKGERIVGSVTDEGKFNKFHEEYYVLAGQNFYSDGLLSVVDADGKKGYINAEGNKAFDFRWSDDCSVKVFTEGFAVVKKKKMKKDFLINKDGEAVTLKFPSPVPPPMYEIANVYKNKFYVFFKNGKKIECYIGDVTEYSGNKVSLKEVEKNDCPKKFSRDYLNRLEDLTKKGRDVPFDPHPKKGSMGLKTSQKNGVYGYEEKDKMILPHQLQSASDFEDGYAVVKINGKWGILEYIAGDSFEVNVSDEPIKYKEGEDVTCDFTLSSCPSVWKGAIKIRIKDDSYNEMPVNNTSFKVTPSLSAQKFMFTVFEDKGLKLYEKEITYSFEKIKSPKIVNKPDAPKCKYCGKPIKECQWAGEKHR